MRGGRLGTRFDGNQSGEFREIVESLETQPMHTVQGKKDGRAAPPTRARLTAEGAVTPPTVTVIIPARNEARNLPYVLPLVSTLVTEVIVVDGRSSDSTVQMARLFEPNVRVIHQSGRGKGDALRCGIAASRGDIVVLMDADGSTDPQEIPRFVQALLDGADYVKGSRYLPSGGSADFTRARNIGNRLLTVFANLVLGAHFTDFCYGYNAFWRDISEVVPIDCEGFEVEAQLNSRAARARLSIAEVPSYERPRIHGDSNLRPARDGVRIALTVLRERWWRAPEADWGVADQQDGITGSSATGTRTAPDGRQRTGTPPMSGIRAITRGGSPMQKVTTHGCGAR